MIGSLKIFTDCVDCEYAVTQILNKYCKKYKTLQINESTFIKTGLVKMEVVTKRKIPADKLKKMSEELKHNGYCVSLCYNDKYYNKRLYTLAISIRKDN